MNNRNARHAFTLVELLTVITIIGILVALVSVAVYRAKLRADQARITVEIQNMDMALTRLANEAGDSYPPDFSLMYKLPNDPNTYFNGEVKSYMARRFPKFRPAPFKGRPGNLNTELVSLFTIESTAWKAANRAAVSLDPAEALVFWLGGMSIPAGGDSTKLKAFSANPMDPVEGEQQANRGATFFEFAPERLVDRDNDGWYEYIPPGNIAGGNGPPYVYFNAKSYAKKWDDPTLALVKYPTTTTSEWGFCKPYGSSDTPNAWQNQKKFQILSAGIDGQYGAPADDKFRLYPRGESLTPTTSNYDKADLDNLSNFTDADFESAKP